MDGVSVARGQGSGRKRPVGRGWSFRRAASSRAWPRRTTLTRRGRVVRRTRRGGVGQAAMVLGGSAASASPPRLTSQSVATATASQSRAARSGSGHPGGLPLPAGPLGEREPALDPGAHAVPARVGGVRRQVGQEQPGLGAPVGPADQQRADQPPVGPLEGRPGALPRPARGGERPQRRVAGLAGRPGGPAGVDPPERVPGSTAVNGGHAASGSGARAG